LTTMPYLPTAYCYSMGSIMNICYDRILLLIFTAGWLSSGFAQQPQVYEAEYRAKAAGLSATAERQLESLGNNWYRLSQTMEVRVLGAKLGEIEESSHFSYVEDRLTPEAYRYQQSGVSRTTEEVSFDWDSGIALSTEDDEQWQLAIGTGTVDKLSFQLVLRQALARNASNDLDINMVDTDEVESHRYQVTGSELVETELGLFDCLRVERIRDPGSERRTTFWLAKNWNMLLIKFEQISGSGSKTELLLEQAVVGGQVVTPLP